MTNAAITGWGKCLPPAVLTNADLSQLFDTSDEWIRSRTGIAERRASHVSLGEMAYVAAVRALACAGLDGKELDLIVFGTCSHDDQVPNMASGLQLRLGANGCGAMDVNTACTSFLYSLSTATALIRSGVVRNALVVGAELITPFMDWTDRNVAVLFGDGAAAVVLQSTQLQEGLLAEHLGCYGDSREILRVHGMGGAYANQGQLYGITRWQFEGQEIFKKAVHGMNEASESALAKLGLDVAAIDLMIPHQANLRIIEAVGKRVGVPVERVFINIERYGNMSAATVAVALCEAVELGRVKPGATLLLPGFGGGLSYCAHVLRWGARVTPLATSDVQLPACNTSGLELIRDVMRRKLTPAAR
ncbi:MAG TPA: ketoacyl-ACP synthase III [Steroidobacteraceae bacterium]|nr:ketoacyl-ACP synthase III [Steroidobacteraceae bacterium]HRX88762.1 ketoacyl-ACP synthase III [Steroidobacteraceae bacterium]